MVWREDVLEVGDLFGGVRVGECLTCGEGQGCTGSGTPTNHSVSVWPPSPSHRSTVSSLHQPTTSLWPQISPVTVQEGGPSMSQWGGRKEWRQGNCPPNEKSESLAGQERREKSMKTKTGVLFLLVSLGPGRSSSWSHYVNCNLRCRLWEYF